MKLLLNCRNNFVYKSLSQKQLSNTTCKSSVEYIQGQEHNKTRQYFYYIDHNGMLFLDDSRMKNFTSCFKDKQFLQFFFKRIRRNNTAFYTKQFPYLSLCGRETNFIRCDDLPIVFTHIIDGNNRDNRDLLSYGYADSLLTVPFEPQTLYMKPELEQNEGGTGGRIYHKAMEYVGGIGLVRSALAIELSKNFIFNDTNSHIPTHFKWKGQTYELTNELQSKLLETQ